MTGILVLKTEREGCQPSNARARGGWGWGRAGRGGDREILVCLVGEPTPSSGRRV